MTQTPDGELEDLLAPELLSVLDQLGYAVAVADGENRCVFASARWCAMLGYTLDELLHLERFDRMIAPEDRERALGLVAARWAGGPPGRHDFRLVRSDGALVTVEAGGRIIQAPSGQLFMTVARDVTADRARERRILRYEESCKRMPSGFMIWERGDDGEYSIQVANPVAREHVDALLAGDGGSDASASGLDVAALVDLEPGETVDLGDWSPDRDRGRTHFHLRGFGLDHESSALIMEDLSSLQAASDERRELLERLISVGDDERRVIADGLHDDTLQRLAASALLVESVERHPDAEDNRRRLLEVEREIRHTIHSLRDLIFELTPPPLEDEGLAAAVNRVSSHLFADVPTTCHVDIDVPADLDHHVASMMYRVAAEALTNVRRHAAAGRVTVTLGMERQRVVGTVSDDGIGPSEVEERPGHLGIRSMRERTEAFGGAFAIGTSERGGTEVVWSVPAHRAVADRVARRPYREWRPPDRRRPAPERRPDDFAALVEATPDVISCFDRSLRHVYVNPAVELVAGLDQSEFLGRSNRDLGMPEELADQWDDVILEAFRTGEVLTDTFVYDTPTGPRTYDARLIPERSRPDGPVLRVWGIVRDVSSYVGIVQSGEGV